MLRFLLALCVIFLLPFQVELFSQSLPVVPERANALPNGWSFMPESEPKRKVEIARGLSSQGCIAPCTGIYEIELFWPEGVFFPPQGLYLNRVQETDRVYINGTLIAETGTFPPYGDYKPNWFVKRLYYIPETLIKKGQANLLQVEVHFRNPSTPGGLFRIVPQIGNYHLLQEMLAEEDGRDAAILMLFFGIGAYQVFHVLMKRQARSNFFLLLATVFFVGWRLPMQNLIYNYFDFDFTFVLRAFNVFQALFPLTIVSLCYSIFKRKMHWIDYLLYGFIGSIAVLHSFHIPISLRFDLLLYWEITLLPLTIQVIRAVLTGFQNKMSEAYFLGVGFGILCLAGLIDIAIDQTSGKNIYLTQYGFLILMILSAVSISYRSSLIEKELSSLTKELEVRVSSRTKELERQNLEMEKDLNLAAQLQIRLLPSSAPKLHQIRLEASYIPMSKVGGDLYDWIELDGERYLFLIADVTGHGVAAALISSMVKVQFREIAKRTEKPEEILEYMNTSLKGFLNLNFVTASCALFDLRNYQLSLASAAHPFPIHFQKSLGVFEDIPARGSILGLKEQAQYTLAERKFAAGDRFFFYTDGVTEARTDDKPLYGEERLLHCLKRTQNEHVSIVSQAILSEISMYSDNEFKDDVSFVILEIRE